MEEGAVGVEDITFEVVISFALLGESRKGAQFSRQPRSTGFAQNQTAHRGAVWVASTPVWALKDWA